MDPSLTGREDTFMATGSSEKQTKWPELRYQTKVHQIIQSLNMEEMEYNLRNLTSFFNRYYGSEHGVQSSRWIYDKLIGIIADALPGVHISLSTFTHTFPQPSVIARFEPARGRTPNNRGIKILRIIILEAFRALVQAGFKPELPVEFHWYAAEEGGLLGSQDVASEYVYQRKDVAAMIQFARVLVPSRERDMTAYVPKGADPNVTFITTDVDTLLTNWATTLATEYSSSPVVGAKLYPGADSDHMSWHRAGFPAIFATEDLKDGEFSFEHALEFAKVAVGFAVELGGWAH
ncbi:Zn-dependent exopeptidase [Imleria badia]|nr:Zn-dependent exopeptidase [Imleria badia]